MSAVYVPLKDGAVYGQLSSQGSTYFMVKDSGIINILAQGDGTYQKYTYFSRLMEICTNSTVTTTVAGEQLTVTNSQCTPSASPLPTAKRFDELVQLLQGLPGPTSQSHWKRSRFLRAEEVKVDERGLAILTEGQEIIVSKEFRQGKVSGEWAFEWVKGNLLSLKLKVTDEKGKEEIIETEVFVPLCKRGEVE